MTNVTNDFCFFPEFQKRNFKNVHKTSVATGSSKIKRGFIEDNMSNTDKSCREAHLGF